MELSLIVDREVRVLANLNFVSERFCYKGVACSITMHVCKSQGRKNFPVWLL